MKRFLLIPLAIILVTVLIFGGCKPPEEVPEEILIGSSVGLTGMYAGNSIGGVFGELAAVDDINSLGGIYVEEYGKKLPVRLIVADNECNELKAATLAEDLILRDKVHALIQGSCPQPMTTPISTVCERYEMPYVGVVGLKEQFVAMRESVSPPWEYSWDIAFAVVEPYPPGSFWDKPGMTMADTFRIFLSDIIGQTNKRAAAYGADDIDGRSWYTLFPVMAEEAGFSICGRERDFGIFPLGNTDFTPLINEWKAYDAELLFGNAPAPDIGTLLRQCYGMGFKPKAVFAGRGGMFYQDINSWGGDLPLGVLTDALWRPTYDPEMCPGIGDATPMSIFDRWVGETGEPLNLAIGLGYCGAQVLFDAIERAGTLDGDAISEAIGETHLKTVWGTVVFDKETHFAGMAETLGQWQKTDEPWVWECPIVFALQPHMGEPAELLFPIPYD